MSSPENRPPFDLLQFLPLFAPNSAGMDGVLTSLTLVGAKQTFPFLCELLEKTGRKLLQPIPAETFCSDPQSRRAADALKAFFDRHGSDKSKNHNYDLVYGALLKEPRGIQAVLEIGVGTNNIDVPSSMGLGGIPGASLRAFRDFLPETKIFGADVDKRILFQERNIRTFYVNQIDRASFAQLEAETPPELDLIIDDGLHAPNANLSVLIFAAGRLKIGGWCVIEDIRQEALPLWQVVAALMAPHYRTVLIAAKISLMFAVQRLS